MILLYICIVNLKSILLRMTPVNLLSFDRGKPLWLDFDVAPKEVKIILCITLNIQHGCEATICENRIIKN
jgi:hypothetical protein